MHGFALINKAPGLTSHDVVAQARKQFGTKKVGHAGTLDPMATGVLVLGIGSATRLLQYVTDGTKKYEATIRLGQSTHTDDREGEVLATTSYLTGVFSDKVTAIGNTGTSQTIALTSGTVYTATLNGNCTFTLSASNSVASRASSFTLILTNDATPGRTVAWSGGTFKFPGGSVTRTTTANAVDVWFFFTPNGGTNWYGSIPMANLS